MSPPVLEVSPGNELGTRAIESLGPEVEVVSIPSLSESQATLLDAHSLINGLNALVGELSLLASTLKRDEGDFHEAFDACDRMVDSLRRRGDALVEPLQIERYREVILAAVQARVPRFLAGPDEREVARSLGTIRHVLDVLKLRADEYACRVRAPGLWVRLPAREVRRQLEEFFRVVEATARGRYRIVFDPERQGAGDYLVDLRIGCGDDELWIPDVLRDVVRDLAANARKYTAPGGTIRVRLTSRDGVVGLAVGDTGRGIPEGDIPGVVHFGARGSNVFDVRTFGGGFGLTKAFLVARRFGGRFWIASRVGVGTSVRLEMPAGGERR